MKKLDKVLISILSIAVIGYSGFQLELKREIVDSAINN